MNFAQLRKLHIIRGKDRLAAGMIICIAARRDLRHNAEDLHQPHRRILHRIEIHIAAEQADRQHVFFYRKLARHTRGLEGFGKLEQLAFRIAAI